MGIINISRIIGGSSSVPTPPNNIDSLFNDGGEWFFKDSNNNVKTLIGADGATGATGPQGVTGPSGGPIGPQGVTGATGPQGPIGATGPQGEKGDTGNDSIIPGPIGATGPQGDVGPKGDKGEIGATGPQGDVGPKGDIGPIGATGPQGDVGPKGDTGNDSIIPGPQGDKGDKGDIGPIGATGPQGDIGPKGDTGDIGPTGSFDTSLIKNGIVDSDSFTGSPYSYVISFSTAYPDNAYTISILGGDVRSWSISSKSNTGFTIESNSSVKPTEDTYWTSIKFLGS